jgi:hypothetical protein
MANPTTGYIVRNGNFAANTDLGSIFQPYSSTLAATTGFKLRTTGQDLNLLFEGLGAQTGTPDPSNTGYKLRTNGYDLVQIFKKIGANGYNWKQTNSGVTYGGQSGNSLPSFTTAMSSDGSIQIQLIPYTNSYAYSSNFGQSFTFFTLNNLVTSCAVSGNGTYGLITTAASGGGTTSIYLSTTLTTSGTFTLLNNTIVPTGQQYSTCAVSSSGKYMCVFDRFNGYCYSANFGATWSGTTLINTFNPDNWNNRYTVVFAAEGTGLAGQPMVYTSSQGSAEAGDLRWYNSFFTATPAVPPTVTGSNPYGNSYASNSGFFSMCLNGNYIYASAGTQQTSNLLLQYNISGNSWSVYTLPLTTRLFSLCNTSTGKVYFISSSSLAINGITDQIYYLTGNNISGGLTLYNNANFAALNANQNVYSIGVSNTSEQYITCINDYLNAATVFVYSDGNSGSS